MKQQSRSQLRQVLGSVRIAFLNWRDKIYASPRFQYWAARFPVTRILVHRRAKALFSLSAGFVYSQLLFSFVKLRLGEFLSEAPRSLNEIADHCELPLDGANRLIKGLVALRLVQGRQPGIFGLGDLGAAMAGNPGIGSIVAHHDRFYADLLDPIDLLKGRKETRVANFWPYARSGGELDSNSDVKTYSEMMVSSQTFIAEHVLDAVSLKKQKHLLDVAGGEGAFACSALRRNSHLKATVLDLPEVADLANNRFEREGLTDRANAVGGNMFESGLPSTPDVVSFIRVLHDHDDDRIKALLSSAHKALPEGGRLIVAEPMAGTRGSEAIGDAYFGMYLWAMGSGRPRTVEELTEMIREAGFSKCEELRTSMPLLVRVVSAIA